MQQEYVCKTEIISYYLILNLYSLFNKVPDLINLHKLGISISGSPIIGLENPSCSDLG